MPAVALPRRKPRDGPERAGNARADDRWLGADREDVRRHRDERADLSEHPRNPEQPREHEDAARDERDVLSRHREEVVEPRRPEVATEAVGEPLVIAEHDSLEQRPPLAVQPGGDRAPEPGAQTVGRTGEPASAADLVPSVAAQYDVHAVAAQPGPLVEAVRRSARQLDLPEHPQDRSLRRRTAERKLEQHRLARAKPAEAPDLCRKTKLEPAAPSRAGDDDDPRLGSTDLADERRGVEASSASSLTLPHHTPVIMISSPGLTVRLRSVSDGWSRPA